MTNYELKMIQEIVGGYKFKNLDLLQQAFIRKSYSQEYGGENNEVLEFIGDKMLDFVVVKKLTSLDESGYGWMSEENEDFDREKDCNEYCCEFDERKLTEIKKKLVCKEMLSKCIDELGLQDYLIMGKGDIEQNIKEKDSVKEDLFEAILGAIAVDSGYDTAVLEQAVDVMLDPVRRIETEILGNEIDYIGAVLQWHMNENNGSLPITAFQDAELAKWNSIIAAREGDDLNGTYSSGSKFHCVLTMWIGGKEKSFGEYGKSKRQARINVFRRAYDYLNDQGLLFTIKDEIDNPNRNDAVGQLEILARRGYFPLPKYEFSQTYDKNGNPIWRVECHIDGEEYYFYSVSSSKKEAKKNAAWEMLKHVLSIDS